MGFWNTCVRIVGAAALTLLAGCSTEPIASGSKLTGKEGAVVFRFITNGTTAFDPAETLSSITLKRELAADSREISPDMTTLERTRAVTNSTAIFSGMLPAGRYRMIEAKGYQGNRTYTFPLQRMLTEFEVKEGEVTLLGTLLVQPLEGSRFTVGYVPPNKELTETFQALFPALAEQTRGRPAHTFQSTPDLRRSEFLAPRVRQAANAHGGVKAEADGSLLAGGKMGHVIWHKAGEEGFRVLHIDTWKEILSVGMYRGGLLAAGEEGLLRYSSDEGRTWQALTPPDRGLIAAVDALSNGRAIAVVRRESTWTAYASDDLLAGAWRKIGSFEQERSLNVPWQNPVPLAGGGRAGVLMPNGVFHVADATTERLERHSTGMSTFSAQIMPDGTLVVRAGTMAATTLVSADGGKTWADLDTSRWVVAITLADQRTLYAIGPADEYFFPDRRHALMISRDRGKTWTKSGEVPGGIPWAIRSLFYDRIDGSLLAFMRDGKILRSTDEGKTWARSL